jgi:hypothetical protein
MSGHSLPFHYDMPRVRISDSEIVIQKACRDMIAKVFPKTRVAAVPNGTNIRSMAGRMKARREGLSAGFPDLILVGDRPGLVAFPEIKAKAVMSEEQREWLVFMCVSGHNCGVFRNPETLMLKMREWGFR